MAVLAIALAGCSQNKQSGNKSQEENPTENPSKTSNSSGISSLSSAAAGKIDFYKVDIDKEQELATVFGIQSIPTFLFIPMKGKPTAQMGAMEKEEFEKIIKEVMGE